MNGNAWLFKKSCFNDFSIPQRINSFKNMISKSAKRLQGNKYVDNRGIEVNDNRYNYDKRLSELSCADDDHPLKTSNFSFSNLAVRMSVCELISSSLNVFLPADHRVQRE